MSESQLTEARWTHVALPIGTLQAGLLTPFAHVGYICALKDPDGNVVQISHGQQVFATIRQTWGTGVSG